MQPCVTLLWAAALFVALWIAWADGAHAETGNAAVLAQTLRKAQAMLVKLSEENTRLSTANHELEGKLASTAVVSAERDALSREIAAKERTTGELRSKNEELVARINRDSERLEKFKEERQTQRAALAKQQADDALLVQAVKERSDWIALCTQNNRELVRVNGELLEQRAAHGWWQQVKDLEPITDRAQVAAEQAEQDFRFKLEDLTVTPWREERAEAQ